MQPAKKLICTVDFDTPVSPKLPLRLGETHSSFSKNGGRTSCFPLSNLDWERQGCVASPAPLAWGFGGWTWLSSSNFVLRAKRLRQAISGPFASLHLSWFYTNGGGLLFSPGDLRLPRMFDESNSRGKGDGEGRNVCKAVERWRTLVLLEDRRRPSLAASRGHRRWAGEFSFLATFSYTF